MSSKHAVKLLSFYKLPRTSQYVYYARAKVDDICVEFRAVLAYTNTTMGDVTYRLTPINSTINKHKDWGWIRRQLSNKMLLAELEKDED